jgi:outer membrane lipoprotein
LIFICTGCVRAISKELKAQVEEEINIQQVIKNPSASQGKMVIWGGEIVTAKNMKEGTVFEIVQKPLTSEERPLNVDRSDGRFLALYDGYLDVAIYSKGREVTVAGRIKETQKRLLGEIDYTYPVVSAQEVHIWPSRDNKKYYISPHWRYPDWHYYPYRRYP